MCRYFFIFLISINLINANSFAAEKIVYLDLDYLLANSNKGKAVILGLENINKKNVQMFKEKENLLTNEERKLIQQKNILSNEIYSEKAKDLKSKINIYREEKKTLITKFKKQREENINNFLKIVDKILAEYVKKNSIDLVLNKKDILMGKNNYNITNEIMNILNNSK